MGHILTENSMIEVDRNSLPSDAIITLIKCLIKGKASSSAQRRVTRRASKVLNMEAEARGGQTRACIN